MNRCEIRAIHGPHPAGALRASNTAFPLDCDSGRSLNVYNRNFKFHIQPLILEKAVGRTHIAQVLDSPGHIKKVLITNKVTTHFFITPFKSQKGKIAVWTAASRPKGEGHGCPESIPSTLHALPTAFSRLI